MIVVKTKSAVSKMEVAGLSMARLFNELRSFIKPGVTTLDVDGFIERYLLQHGLKARCKNYKGYKHASCISINDVVVHGVPSSDCIIKLGDLVKVDVVASYKGYCADMARCFLIGQEKGACSERMIRVSTIAYEALDAGIHAARVGNRVSDISRAIEQVAVREGLGIVRVFAGHGIGKLMHEEPEVPNYTTSDPGVLLRPGMALAIEPMLTLGDHAISIDPDGWTARTVDGSLAAHVEDTVLVTSGDPRILTRIEEGGCGYEA